MPLPLIPIAIAGGAFIAKDVIDFFRPDPEPPPAGGDGQFLGATLPKPVVWSIAGVVAFAGFRAVRKFLG